MLPKYKEIQLPLLREIRNRGGSTKPSTINSDGLSLYASLAEYFDLTDDDLAQTTEKENRSKWKNMVRWARNDLKKIGFLSSPSRGIWAITEKGEDKLREFEKESLSRKDFVSDTHISYEALQESLQFMQQLGYEGELYALEYEKQRLINEGRKDLIKEIQQVSKTNVAAGFDILSFEANGDQRFIEVKSTKNQHTGFRITRNELKKANEYKEKYWIYYIIFGDYDNVNLLKYKDLSQQILEHKFKLIPTDFLVVKGENE